MDRIARGQRSRGSAGGSSRPVDIGSAVDTTIDAPVRVCLLGGFRLLRGAECLPVRPDGRLESLLIALAIHGQAGLPRDELLLAVWPGAEERLAGQALNTLVHSLRINVAEAIGGQPPVVHQGGRYRLNRSAGVITDVELFDTIVDQGDRALRRNDESTALRAYAAAVSTYEGDLVPGSNIQQLLEAERLRARFLTALSHLAMLELRYGDADSALHTARAALRHDPYNEEAHRIAMRAYVRLGQRTQAFRQFELCRSLLAREFEAGPEASTEELYRLIRSTPELV